MVSFGLGQLVDGYVRITKNGRVYRRFAVQSHLLNEDIRLVKTAILDQVNKH